MNNTITLLKPEEVIGLYKISIKTLRKLVDSGEIQGTRIGASYRAVAPAEEILTLEEVARELRLSYKTVYEFVKAGRIPAHKLGCNWRITRSNVEKLKIDGI